MVFSSAIFLFFFLPLALGAYFAAPPSWRNAVLLVASLVFYAWGEKSFVLWMLASIALNYGVGRWLEAVRDRYGKVVLAGGVAVNLSLLVAFKYANFAAASVNEILGAAALPAMDLPSIHLPIGISFFTFEAISYLVDIYRRRSAAERHPVRFGLYMTLFPHLVAGPVVRYRDLADALGRRTATAAQIASGIRRFCVGLGKKMLLANALGAASTTLFQLPPGDLGPGAAWLGAVAYALHIYFDFSAYSDMAIGLGRLFGFELCENFRYPYAAASMTDFWRRWHISLSNWFRDYLYIPLGGNRQGTARTYGNLFVVFLLCGLWHGASWNFAAWGLYHGVFLVLERGAIGRQIERLPRFLRHAYTLIAVLGGWVFFAAPSLTHALAYFQAMLSFRDAVYSLADFLHRELLLALVLGAVFCLPAAPWLRERLAGAASWRPVAEFARAAVPLALLLAAAVYLAAGTHNPFIYYRF